VAKEVKKFLLITMLSTGVWVLLLPWLLGWALRYDWLASLLRRRVEAPVHFHDLMQLASEPVALLAVFMPWLLFTLLLFRRCYISDMVRFEREVKSGNLDEIRVMIEKGQDINMPIPGGQTVLQFAVMQGDVAMVGLLLGNGADFDIEDPKTGMTPLLNAARDGRHEIVEMLVRFGADINTKNRDGDTPLHLSAARGHRTAIEVLLKYRPDLEARNNAGITALQQAEQNRHEQVAMVIRQYSSRQWAYLNISNG
jgi:ankyrin repeat protein